MAESWRTGRSATSLPSATLTLVTSIVTPALRRAVRPAPISKPSSPPPNRAYEKPSSEMTFAITSTIGWASPSGASLARNTRFTP